MPSSGPSPSVGAATSAAAAAATRESGSRSVRSGAATSASAVATANPSKSSSPPAYTTTNPYGPPVLPQQQQQQQQQQHHQQDGSRGQASRRAAVRPAASATPRDPLSDDDDDDDTRFTSRSSSAPLRDIQRQAAASDAAAGSASSNSANNNNNKQPGSTHAVAIPPDADLQASQSLPRQAHPTQQQQQQPSAPSSAAHLWDDGQDEDEVAGVVGAVRHYQPFQNPEVSEPLPEINIAVIGAEGVGKSTFVQKALDLPHPPPSQAAERKIPVDGNTYLVRLLELPLQELDIDDDDKINWPDTIDDKMMPRIDGALALYDVRDKGSIDDLPEMLSAIYKAALPTILISCKCDAPFAEREVDPALVERDAKKTLSGLNTLRTSDSNTESHKGGIFMLLKAIINNSPEEHFRSASATRRRAQSNAVRPVSPRTPGLLGHSRASSEFTGGLLKDQRHTRHDSSLAAYGSGDRLRVPTDDPMHGSFLLEESPSEADSVRSSIDVDSIAQSLGVGPASSSLAETGATFDELVDRLLAQPTSKADAKFAAIFLALYRKFAAPGRLLEAIVSRFDALEHDGSPQMTKTVAQLRFVAVLEQWVTTYPGDFAFPRTKQRLRTFVTKLALSRIFAVAAKEIGAGIDAVQEDDDTEWAYCDRLRDSYAEHSRNSLSSTASTLIDDPAVIFAKELNGSTLSDDPPSLTPNAMRATPASNQLVANVEAAQKQAELLHPIPRYPLSKTHWRTLMEQSDDAIARELTRIDWIMFSAIRPRDLVRHVSLSSGQKSQCKNVVHVNRMIEHFNQLACWVANFILLRDKPKHRALMLEKLMRVARRVRDLNNYNALGAIIAGVKSTSIHRLAATRDLISAGAGRDWLKLEVLMGPSKSYSAYRLAWVNSSDERIPYLPLHRRDLVTAEEGNKTFLDDDSGGGGKNGKINWKKFEIMGEVIVSMQRAQGMPYRGLGPPKGHEQIRELVLDVKLTKDEEELYERSLQCEPAATASGTTSAKFREFFKR